MDNLFEEEEEDVGNNNRYPWDVEEELSSGTSEEVDIMEKAFTDLCQRLKKIAGRTRKSRHSLVDYAIKLFEKTVKNPEWVEKLANSIEIEAQLSSFIDRLLDTIISISKALHQLLEEVDVDIIQRASQFNIDVCTLLEYLSRKLNVCNFLEQTSRLQQYYLNLTLDNPNSWTVVLIAGGPLELIGLAYFSVENKEIWSERFKPEMLLLHQPITKCGDFECQRSLLVSLISWLSIIPPETKKLFLKRSFREILPKKFLESLFKNFDEYDADYKSRYFLNTLNGELIHRHRPSSVHSISCTNVFLEGQRIQPPYHLDIEEFWIDFSCKSKRIHFYCSFPNSSSNNNTEWHSISFHKQDIDSVCLFYPANGEAAEQENEYDLNNMTQFSAGPSQRDANTATASIICYVHILLKNGFDTLCPDAGFGVDKRSLVFEFKDADRVEEVLEFFQFDVHECDVETYKKLVSVTQNISQHQQSQKSQSKSNHSSPNRPLSSLRSLSIIGSPISSIKTPPRILTPSSRHNIPLISLSPKATTPIQKSTDKIISSPESSQTQSLQISPPSSRRNLFPNLSPIATSGIRSTEKIILSPCSNESSQSLTILTPPIRRNLFPNLSPKPTSRIRSSEKIVSSPCSNVSSQSLQISPVFSRRNLFPNLSPKDSVANSPKIVHSSSRQNMSSKPPAKAKIRNLSNENVVPATPSENSPKIISSSSRQNISSHANVKNRTIEKTISSTSTPAVNSPKILTSSSRQNISSTPSAKVIKPTSKKIVSATLAENSSKILPSSSKQKMAASKPPAKAKIINRSAEKIVSATSAANSPKVLPSSSRKSISLKRLDKVRNRSTEKNVSATSAAKSPKILPSSSKQNIFSKPSATVRNGITEKNVSVPASSIKTSSRILTSSSINNITSNSKSSLNNKGANASSAHIATATSTSNNKAPLKSCLKTTKSGQKVPCYKRKLPNSPEPSDPYDIRQYCRLMPRKNNDSKRFKK